MNKYDSIKTISEVAYNFLMNFYPENYPDGRFNLDNGIYFNIESYITKESSRFEVHKRYIDIQFIISGEEKIILSDRKELCTFLEDEYYQERDIAFYKYVPELSTDEYVLRCGDFLVIKPGIFHMPCIQVSDRATNVRKMVLKIPYVNYKLQ